MVGYQQHQRETEEREGRHRRASSRGYSSTAATNKTTTTSTTATTVTTANTNSCLASPTHQHWKRHMSSPPSSSSTCQENPSTGVTRTIVIKIGTSSLCDETTFEPRHKVLESLVANVSHLRRNQHKVVLVTSGAVGVGMRRLKLTKKPDTKNVPALQVKCRKRAIAAVGQPELIHMYTKLFHAEGLQVAQILLARGDIAQHAHYINACNTLKTLLDHPDVIPIINENDAVSVSQLRFGDNDTLSAMVAGMVSADVLFLLTDVDAVYTDNPRCNPDAKPVRSVDDLAEFKTQVDVAGGGSQVGTGGMSTKLSAAELATSAGVTMIIMHSSEVEKMVDTVNASDIPLSQSYGTTFLPVVKKLTERKWWIWHGLTPKGHLIIDIGASSALLNHKASLFAAGILEVSGSFLSESAVDIYSSSCQHVPVAKGIVEYSSLEIAALKGRQSGEIQEVLGYAETDHVIHRDNIVRLEGGQEGFCCSECCRD